MSKIQAAQAAHRAAVERLHEVADRIEAATELETDDLSAEFDAAQSEVERSLRTVNRYEAIEASVAANPLPEVTEPAFHAVARGSLKSEPTYREDRGGFLLDMLRRHNDSAAAERVARHEAEQRDVTTASGSGGGVVPPVYMSAWLAEYPRAARPFADICPKVELPAAGMTLSVPRLTTGTSEAIQTADNAAVSETDFVAGTLSVPVRTIAGQSDISQQLLDRGDSNLERIIFGDLGSAYNAALDTQLISGSGSSGQHTGIRAVSGINSVTYTDASPTAAEALPKVYDAIQQIASGRFVNPSHIVMHPRRAAWFGSNLSSTFALFQQGSLVQASGSQNGGFISTLAGLPVVVDANVGTTYGAGSNEDEIYVVFSGDLFLSEGPQMVRTLFDVGSGTLTVRLQLFAYSAFASGRQPEAIAAISGTGLVTPSFS